MKNFKKFLHIMITAASVIGFLGGWATLAHSKKPGQTTTSSFQTTAIDPLPPLDPMPSLDTASSSTDNQGLSIIAPPVSNQNNNTVSSTNNSATTSNPNTFTRRARPVFTTTGS